MQAQGWAAQASVVNDTFAVLRAGLDQPAGPHWGVGVTVGAGINCVGVTPDGRTTRFLSLGPISGDWGGGGDLGQRGAPAGRPGRGRPRPGHGAAHRGAPALRPGHGA